MKRTIKAWAAVNDFAEIMHFGPAHHLYKGKGDQLHIFTEKDESQYTWRPNWIEVEISMEVPEWLEKKAEKQKHFGLKEWEELVKAQGGVLVERPDGTDEFVPILDET